MLTKLKPAQQTFVVEMQRLSQVKTPNSIVAIYFKILPAVIDS